MSLQKPPYEELKFCNLFHIWDFYQNWSWLKDYYKKTASYTIFMAFLRKILLSIYGKS